MSFVPLQYHEASEGAGRPLPQLWMITPAAGMKSYHCVLREIADPPYGTAVCGTVFYHMAMVLILINEPPPSRSSAFDSANFSRDARVRSLLSVNLLTLPCVF
jgi:hypothetical protein